MKSSILAAVAYSAFAEEGHTLVCVGDRAHLVTYNIPGDDIDTAEEAEIEFSRSAENDMMCVNNGSEDDKSFCFGANTDETCTRAIGALTLTDNFECTNCWAGITADLYYKLKTTLGVPTKIEVGVRNTHISGALQVRAHGDSAVPLTTGSLDLPAPAVHVNFNAGSIPLNFTISLPLRIDYNLGLKGELDATAGGALDVDFGDHAATITPTSVKWENTDFTTDLEPTLVVDAGDSGADIGLALAGAMQVGVLSSVANVDYHVDFSAGLPSKIKLENGDSSLPSQLCFEGDLDIPVTQEAQAYKTVFGRKVPLYTYGPAEITHIQQEKALLKCVDFASVVV